MGSSIACSNSGVMLRDGRGVAKDKKRAAQLFERACEMNDERGCSLKKGVG